MCNVTFKDESAGSIDLRKQKTPNNVIPCPYCQSTSVNLIDHEALQVGTSKNDAEQHAVDNEIYADGECQKCKRRMKLQGKITWNIPDNKYVAFAAIWGSWEQCSGAPANFKSYESRVDIVTGYQIPYIDGYTLEDIRKIFALSLGEEWNCPKHNHKLIRIS
jgi:hypothetical protein